MFALSQPLDRLQISNLANHLTADSAPLNSGGTVTLILPAVFRALVRADVVTMAAVVVVAVFVVVVPLPVVDILASQLYQV